jgi:membrane protein DedA with SNARE-associated domain
MHEMINWLLTTIGTMGYPGIFILMAMESSIIPVPSELVMPPAGYLAQQGEMNIWVAILMGTVGSLVGAYANYFTAHYLGRPLVLKYGKYVWITEEKFTRVEKFFLKHGEISTLVGAGIWCTILAWIGYFIGKEQALIMKYSHQAVIGVVLFSIVLVAVYVWRHKRKEKAQV